MRCDAMRCRKIAAGGLLGTVSIVLQRAQERLLSTKSTNLETDVKGRRGEARFPPLSRGPAPDLI